MQRQKLVSKMHEDSFFSFNFAEVHMLFSSVLFFVICSLKLALQTIMQFKELEAMVEQVKAEKASSHERIRQINWRKMPLKGEVLLLL